MILDAEFAKREFWATHYCLLMTDFEQNDDALLERFFGIAPEPLWAYDRALTRPPGATRPLVVALRNGFGLEVEYTDCGEDGTEVRYYVTGKHPAFRELIGYQSPSWALPALRWDEVKKIHGSLSDPGAAAVAGLLALPAAFLTTDDKPQEVAACLTRWWSALPGEGPNCIDELVGNIVENIRNPELRWREHAVLGWINNSSYSFRNPHTLMCEYSDARFDHMRQFLAGID